MSPDPALAAMLLALAVTAHNVEEMIWLPAFPHPPALEWDVPARAFRFAAIIVALVFWVAALALAAGLPAEPVVAGFAMMMIVNAFVPHLGLSAILRRYHPGTATGLLLVVPGASIYLVAVDAANRMQDMVFLAGAAAGAAFLAASVPLLLMLGRRLV